MIILKGSGYIKRPAGSKTYLSELDRTGLPVWISFGAYPSDIVLVITSPTKKTLLFCDDTFADAFNLGNSIKNLQPGDGIKVKFSLVTSKREARKRNAFAKVFRRNSEVRPLLISSWGYRVSYSESMPIYYTDTLISYTEDFIYEVVRTFVKRTGKSLNNKTLYASIWAE